MSIIGNLSSTLAALPAVNVHPHGHKRGLHAEASKDSKSDNAAQVPARTAQNLFGSLLKSLEQVIDLQSATAAAAPASTSAGATAATASTSGAGQTPAGLRTFS